MVPVFNIQTFHHAGAKIDALAEGGGGGGGGGGPCCLSELKNVLCQCFIDVAWHHCWSLVRTDVFCCDFILCAVATFLGMSLVRIDPGRASLSSSFPVP